ncbi:hypothetical protein K438DRAFT_1984501 [Mycena galopus ATCC 62051]|nr:hypothetical protein K438DRAFT_1984501 [Mycena galopus ATCC 62051]
MLYELVISAFLAALIVLVPLPWHWCARNCKCDNTIEATALVRVDFTTELEIGATMALTTVEQRTRRRIFNLALCLGLYYIVQGHRFDLIQYFGARPTTYTSLPTIFWVRQLVDVALTLDCACTTLAHIFRHRLQLRANLTSQSQ